MRAVWVLALALGLVACGPQPEERSAAQVSPAPKVDPAPATHAAPPDASYVGVRACAECHADEARRWAGSHHDLALQEPAPSTVLGDFDGPTVEAAGESLRFIREGEDYLVEVTRPGEEALRYPVRYTFGVEPLQQLLLDVGDGRLQALTTAWDARPADAGGQRWFSLRDDAPPGDALHWAGPGYNWNSRCADCHSTAVVRGYDPTTDRFDTQHAALDVGCEACHGPGSAHVEWAQGSPPDPADKGRGLVRALTKADERRWVLTDGNPIARLSTIPDHSEPDSCAPCHARRSELGPGRGQSFDDRYRLELLEDPLYFHDGQIRDEVFVYGSFIQSKMYAAGVVCSDCHDPHTLKLRSVSMSETCAGCHRPEVFAAPTHHFHPTDSPAARCESCHMPERVYMGVDGRRDHRFAVPQPQLSARVGAPDPCLACHEDQDPAWAQAAIETNFGPRAPRWEFATALWMARAGQPEAIEALVSIVSESHGPAIVRATALTELASFPSPKLAETIADAANSEEPLVRRAAATAASSLPPPARLASILALLSDPIRSVRIEAVTAFLGADTRGWPRPARAALDAALEDYRAAKTYNADRVEALVDLAALDMIEGKPELAQARLEQAIERDPAFTPAHLNLADLHRAHERDAEAEVVLRAAIAPAAEPALVHHALGLALIRMQRSEEALSELRSAYELGPGRARLGYVYAIALFDSGQREQAMDVLEAVHLRHRADALVLSALIDFSRKLGRYDDATRHAATLSALQGGAPPPTNSP